MALQSAFKLDYRAAAAAIAGADAPFFTAPVGRGSLRPTASCTSLWAKGDGDLRSRLFALAAGFTDAITCWVIFYGR